MAGVFQDLDKKTVKYAAAQQAQLAADEEKKKMELRRRSFLGLNSTSAWGIPSTGRPMGLPGGLLGTTTPGQSGQGVGAAMSTMRKMLGGY